MNTLLLFHVNTCHLRLYFFCTAIAYHVELRVFLGGRRYPSQLQKNKHTYIPGHLKIGGELNIATKNVTAFFSLATILFERHTIVGTFSLFYKWIYVMLDIEILFVLLSHCPCDV